MVAIVSVSFAGSEAARCGLDGDPRAEGRSNRTRQGRSETEDGGRRLFCFAMQSRLRRRKIVDDRRCGQAIGAKPAPLGEINPSRGRMGGGQDSQGDDDLLIGFRQGATMALA